MLRELDIAVFRFVNKAMSVPALDPFITFFNGGAWFKRIGIILGILAFWKGGLRLRLCLVFLGLAIALGDGVIIGGLKRTFERKRPYVQLTDVRHITGKGDAFSMPSGHAANSMAAAVVVATFYRRLRYVAFFVAFMVSFARVYSGVHFPSDVLVGATLAFLYANGLLLGAEWLWRKKGPLVAPEWTRRVPSLLLREEGTKEIAQKSPESPAVDSYDWKRLGWYLIGAVTVLRLLYISSGKIELSEDEAYQWLWSKHLALSYYSKPPLIAYTQFLGTSIWGNTQFGIRFFSPLLAAANAALLLTFLSRVANSKVAFFVVAAACATPMLAVGATLMTIDALSVFFWTLAMVLTWRAVERGSTKDWALAGAAIGFGILAKYIALAQWVCVGIFLWMYPAAQKQFRRPGLYLAMLISLLALLPVAIWNQQNGWITLTHLNERSGLNQEWRFRSGFIIDFVLAEFGLLNPVFVALTVWACMKFWKNRTPLQTLLFCMGAPLFLGFFLYTIRARVQPNWIAPAILPLFALGATFWDARWSEARRWLKPALQWGFGAGLVLVIFLHDTNLTEKISGYYLPAKIDPLARVRGWSTLTRIVHEERQKLAANGKEPFVIGGHYGITSLMTFYTRETRRSPAGNRSIYSLATEQPVNQFYFWPNYVGRTGEDALFVQREGRAAPDLLAAQFERVEDLGVRDIAYRGRVLHQIRLYACRNLRPQSVVSERR